MAYSPAFSQAIEILIYIEMKTTKGYVQYCSAPKIAEGLAIPLPSVKRLLAMLSKANLLNSKKGINGGLALARLPKEISLYDILTAVEGQSPLFPVYEGFDLESFVDRDEVEPILVRSKQLLASIDQTMIKGLQAQSLGDLLGEA